MRITIIIGVWILTTFGALADSTAIRVVKSQRGFDETIEHLTTSIKTKGLKVFTVLDHAAAAQEFGKSMPPAKVILFGNPAGGTPVFLAHPTLALDLPLRILVFIDQHGAVNIAHRSGKFIAETIFAPHGVTVPEKDYSAMQGLFEGLAPAQ